MADIAYTSTALESGVQLSPGALDKAIGAAKLSLATARGLR